MRPINADALIALVQDSTILGDGFKQAFCALVNGEPTIEPEPQWIPVTERLPEPRTDVWVNSDIGQIQGYYEENAETWYASFGQGRDYLELIVNAWTPLPEPWKEGENDV